MGNFIIEGIPGGGKTVLGTQLAIEALRDSGTKAVFTTWPVHDLKTDKVTKMWERKNVDTPIFDSEIFIDEAWMWYPSRGSGRKYVENINQPGVTHKEHLMFAGGRHQGNNFYFITQSINRLDTIIRELYDTIYVVEKKPVPLLPKIPIIGRFIDFPLWINVNGFHDEKAMNINEPYEHDRLYNLPFSRLRKVFKAFDTQYLRKSGIMDTALFREWSRDVDMCDYIMNNTGIAYDSSKE